MAKAIEISYKELLDISPVKTLPLTVGVAVSGGRDSVALLHCLKRLELACEAQDVKIVAVNIEHGIRGEASVKDSEFVRELCAELDVPLYSFSVDVPAFAKQKGYTLEQAGRALRYEIFDGMTDSGKCDVIALAHHLDDQIETVFMRILRGTGIRGLCAMSVTNGRYIRPLLKYSREDIEDYIAANGLKYVDDESNLDTAYTRNFLRQQLGVIKRRFPEMGGAVQRLVDSAVENEEYFESVLPQIEVYGDEAVIKTADCANKAIAKRLILKACKALGVSQDIEEKHYAAALGLLCAENGKKLDFTHGISVHKDRDTLVFSRKKAQGGVGEIPFAMGSFDGICVEKVDLDGISFGTGEALFADLDKIPEGAVIRTRRDGDFICKFGGGTKSLGDFLTDKKVPLRTRDSLKVIADGSRILAVFGVEISADVKIDGNTKRAVALKIIK